MSSTDTTAPSTGISITEIMINEEAAHAACAKLNLSIEVKGAELIARKADALNHHGVTYSHDVRFVNAKPRFFVFEDVVVSGESLPHVRDLIKPFVGGAFDRVVFNESEFQIAEPMDLFVPVCTYIETYNCTMRQSFYDATCNLPKGRFFKVTGRKLPADEKPEAPKCKPLPPVKMWSRTASEEDFVPSTPESDEDTPAALAETAAFIRASYAMRPSPEPEEEPPCKKAKAADSSDEDE